MASLGNLSVFLTLNMVGFAAGMKTAQGQVHSLSAAVQANSAVFKAAGRNIMLAGAVIVAGLAFAAKAAMDFENQMAFVNSMLTSTTEHYLPSFSKELRVMAVQYGQTTESLTKGTYDILSAQVDAGEAMNFMTVAAKAAVGGFTSVDVATDALLTIMKTFKNTIGDVTDAADWMHSVVERGRITFEGLAGSIGTTAAMAAQAGMTLEDYGTAIAGLTKGGLSAEKSQTALRGILRSVLKVQDEAIDTAKEMGLAWNVDALRGDNFVKTLQKLNGTQIEYLSKLSPNIRGLLGWAVALSDVNEAARDHAAILNRAGLTQEKFEKASTTLTFQWNRFKAAIFDSRVVIGTALVPALKDLIKLVVDISGKITEFAEKNEKLFGWIVKLAAVFGLLAIPIGFLIMSLPGLIIVFTKLGLAMVALKVKMLLMGAAFATWAVTLTGMIVIIGALVVAVTGATFAWWAYHKAQKGVEEANKTLANTLKNNLTKALEENNKMLKERADTLTEAQRKEIELNSQLISSLINTIKSTDDFNKLTEEQKNKIYATVIALQKQNFQLKLAIESNTTLAEVQKSSFEVTEETLKTQIRRTKEYIELERKVTLASLKGVEQRVKAIEFEKLKALDALEEKFDKESLEYELMSDVIIDYYDLLVATAEEAAEETGNAFNFMEELATQSARNIQNAFADFFFDAFTGELRTAEDMFRSFGNAILRTWSNILAQMAVESMKSNLFPLIMKLVGGIGGFFGMATNMPTPTGSYPGGYAPSGYADPIGTYATGTNFVPQTGLYNLHKGEAVIDAQQNAKGGETVIQPVVVIQAWDTRDVTRNMDTISAGLAQSLRSNSSFREAVRKYGR